MSRSKNRGFDSTFNRTFTWAFTRAFKAAGKDPRIMRNYSVSTPVAKPYTDSATEHRVSALRRRFAQALGQASVMVLVALTPAVVLADPGGESYESVANRLGTLERYKMPRTLRRRNSSDEVYLWGVSEHSADSFTRMTGWRVSKSLHVGYQQGLDSGLSLLWQGERDQMSVSSDGIRFTRRF